MFLHVVLLQASPLTSLFVCVVVLPSIQVNYLGKVTITGTQFLSGCTESAVMGLVERRGRAPTQGTNALLEIRPFQVRLHHLDDHNEASVTSTGPVHLITRLHPTSNTMRCLITAVILTLDQR